MDPLVDRRSGLDGGLDGNGLDVLPGLVGAELAMEILSGLHQRA
jgi:hypothetical protein